MLILPRRSVYKPAEGVGVNWSDPLTQGLVRLWLMNEGGGARLKDLVRGDDLVAAGTPGWGSGPRGPVTTYTNTVSTHYAVAAASPTLSGTFTVAFWAMQTTSNNATIFTTRTGSDHSFDMGFSGLTKFHGDVGDGASAWLSTAVDLTYATVLGLWYHVVTVITPTGWAVYASSPGKARGQASGGFSGTPVLWNATHTLQIGSGGSNNAHLIGAIDSVMVWNRALGADEVLRLADPADLGFLQPLGVARGFWFFQQFKGSAAVVPPKSTLAASGTEKIAATASEAPPTSTLAALAAETVVASGAAAPPTSSLALAAAESFGATVTEAPPTAVLAVSATERFAASGTVSLGASLNGSGGQHLDGTGSLAGESTLAAHATERLAGSGAVVGPAPTLDGRGTISAIARPSGGVGPGAPYYGTPGIPPFVRRPRPRPSPRPVAAPIIITGVGGVESPGAIVAVAATNTPHILGVGAVESPPPIVAASGKRRRLRYRASATVAVPAPRVAAEGTVALVGQGAVVVPPPIVAGRGAARLVVAPPTVVVAARLFIRGVAAIESAPVALLARGRVRRPLWQEIEDDVLLGLLPEEELLRVA